MHNREPNSNFGLIHFVNLGFDDPAESQVSIWRGKKTVITRITRQPDYLIFSQIFILQASELPPCLRCLIHKCCRSGRLFVTQRVWRYPSLKRLGHQRLRFWDWCSLLLLGIPRTMPRKSAFDCEVNLKQGPRTVELQESGLESSWLVEFDTKPGQSESRINNKTNKSRSPKKEDRPQLHSKWQSMNSWRDNNRKHSNGMGWLLCTYCYWVWIPIHIGQMVPAQY